MLHLFDGYCLKTPGGHEAARGTEAALIVLNHVAVLIGVGLVLISTALVLRTRAEPTLAPELWGIRLAAVIGLVVVHISMKELMAFRRYVRELDETPPPDQS